MPQSFTLNVLVHEVHFAAVCRHEWAGASFRTQVEISIFVVLKVDSLCYLVVWMKQFHLCFFKKKKRRRTSFCFEGKELMLHDASKRSMFWL